MPYGQGSLTIASKNYGSWSLRGWLLCKLAGLAFEEQIVASDDPSTRAELLLLSPSFLVPCLTHDGVKIWDTLAIGEYLNEILPAVGLLPKGAPPGHVAARSPARCIPAFPTCVRALPMNLKAHHPGFKVWAGAQADIKRIVSIWRECLATDKGPYLFGFALHGRRHVRAGRHAIPQLRREARQRLRRLLRDDYGNAANARMG